jgi:hypothetical protein
MKDVNANYELLITNYESKISKANYEPKTGEANYEL